MNVSVLTGSWDYEGGYVLGVFKDENIANEIKERLELENNYDHVQLRKVSLDKLLQGEEKLDV